MRVINETFNNNNNALRKQTKKKVKIYEIKIDGFVFNRHIEVLHSIVKWCKKFKFSDGVITLEVRYYNYAVCNFIIRCGLCRRVERLDRKRELPWKEYHEW